MGKGEGCRKQMTEIFETKRCFRCKQIKPVSEFYRSNTRYYQRECKICNKERKYAWHHTDSGKISSANTKLKRRYGITLEEYEKMLESVGGRCEICGASNSDHGHRLGVDHNHATGEIRGILCKSCNVAISRFKDDASIMRRASEYISRIGTLRTVEKLKDKA